MASVAFGYESVAVEEFTLQVLDSDGRPVPGVQVLETWRDYGFESDHHRIGKTTNSHGIVKFPPAMISGTAIGRRLGHYWQVLKYFPHEGRGVYGDVSVNPRDEDRLQWNCGNATIEPRKPLPNQLICRRTSVP